LGKKKYLQSILVLTHQILCANIVGFKGEIYDTKMYKL